MKELRDILERKSIAMLLIKGETLTDNYPQPDLRESGDVDFVARDDFEGCNALVESLGIEVKSQEKHTSFIYKGGVHFENHTLEPTGGYNHVHHRTLAFLRESMPQAVWRKDGCLELDPVTQAVFVVKHTAQHVCYSGGKIALRMLLDLALLLRTGFRNGWDSHTQRRARRFTHLFLTESNRYVRYFAKLTFLPLRPSEILRMWYEKARSLLSNYNVI